MNNLVFDESGYPAYMGYSANFSAKLKYAPFKENKPLKYNGLITVFIDTENCEEVSLPEAFNPTKVLDFHSAYEGNVEMSVQNPLSIEISVKEKRLQRKPEYVCDKNESLRANKILEDLEIRNFNYENLIKILEWMRTNLKPKKKTELDGVEFTLENKGGNCRDLHQLLNYFVKKVGGISYSTRGCRLIRKSSEKKLCWHYWNQIYYNDMWNIVDPMIYVNSSEMIKSQAINQTKDIYYFPTPSIVVVTSPKEKVEMQIIDCEINRI